MTRDAKHRPPHRRAPRLARTFVDGGRTTIGELLAERPDIVRHFTKAQRRILMALSPKLSRFEAIDTSGDTFLAAGIVGWHAGTKSGEGELPALVGRLARSDARAFHDLFGRFGFGVTDLFDDRGGQPLYGRFTVHGTTVRTVNAKETHLRCRSTAEMFAHAGANDAFRRAQLDHVLARIGHFSTRQLRGAAIGAWLTSELGVALALDQHIADPAGLTCELATAIDRFRAISGRPLHPNSHRWTRDHERAVTELYASERRATAYALSHEPGSYVIG